jgi:protein-tyrosine phosphatase
MQRYNWTGTLNTRDLGGTPTTNGEYVKYQKFIRSDAPNKISNDIRDFLVDRDIKTIIDLRNENIGKRAPNAFFQNDRFQRYNFPLSINAKVPNSEGDFIENYYCMLENEIAIANIFKIMENSKSGVLFYCQEGKDRTGLIAAIILLLAEVSDIDIFADYEISNVYLYEMVKEITCKQVEWLLPIYYKIHEQLLSCDLLHMDETRIQCNKEENRKASSNFFMWVIKSAASESVQAAYSGYNKAGDTINRKHSFGQQWQRNSGFQRCSRSGIHQSAVQDRKNICHANNK